MTGDNKTYTAEEILALVAQSSQLSNSHKSVITTYIDAALQAAYNAATGEGNGIDFIQPTGKLGGDFGIDLWEIYYNQMMQAICLGSIFGADAYDYTPAHFEKVNNVS
jgi:hypothetical protein